LADFIRSQTESFDVITSSDTLCYFGALEEVFQGAARALKPAGFFAFTLEDSGTPAPVGSSTHCAVQSRQAYVERR